MIRSLPLARLAFCAAAATACLASVRAAEPAFPTRWVRADDLRVRAGPSPEYRVLGTLSRGAELRLRDVPGGEYCGIDGEGYFGYVACAYLSAEPVARPRAGENGVDAARRWVGGNSVVVREAPAKQATVVARLAVNTAVTLLGEAAGTGYCDVQPAEGPHGYTACRYLERTPVVLARVAGAPGPDEAASPDYDPERVFWLSPSWEALEAYATHLGRRHPDVAKQGPWPRDEALERMKAHLALGIRATRPAPYPDWLRLKRKAAAARQGTADAQWAAGELEYGTGLSDLQQVTEVADGSLAPIVRLVQALEFPAVQPSLFRREDEIAPPGATAEQASGRFGIVFRQLVTPRVRPAPGAQDGGDGAGLYDMAARTQLLVRPVRYVRLFRDGRVQVTDTHLRSTEVLWRDADGPECEGWVPGFSYGDADDAIWHYTDDGVPSSDEMASASHRESLKRNPAGSLYAFHTTVDVPSGQAVRTAMPVTLDRKATGFMGGLHLNYDLDGDGIPDLAVWEGQGKGPGHLDGPTTTDDRWYRLVLVNIDGAWKVLGSDFFGYGCGC